MIANAQAKDLIDRLKINPFIDGPAIALAKAMAELFAMVPEFRYIFRDNIDTYERVDYSARALPALRVYNMNYRKEHESHYITGEMVVDVIYPANLRRDELQYFQDILSWALLQQLRRPNYFALAKEKIPGLNELGKVYDVDKSLGMRSGTDEAYVPLTQMKANFRIDLKMWDDYLEKTGRTKDDPFNVTLADLKTIAGQIVPLQDDSSPESDATIDLTVTV